MAGNLQAAALAVAVLVVSGGVSRAQQRQPRDAWLMQNYRFTGPPAAGSIPRVDPVVSDLRQILNTLLSIMRKADYAEDYEAALAAADQAAATAQLIGAVSEHLQSAALSETIADARSDAPAPVYAIAFKDHTVEAATAWWIDGPMLHYMTRQGAHVQVRLDLVDRGLSAKLNQGKVPKFSLPE
ncbi:MAG TPA: hypothetical protein VKB88_29500 [Bryobacteraceae bacterium]|nr:hypothetical protein [Bryobacteraceae bacterium]